MKVLEPSSHHSRSLLVTVGVALLLSGCNICGGVVEKKATTQVNSSETVAPANDSNRS
jgi:hypothetical protein